MPAKTQELKDGDKAPAFALKDDAGAELSLDALKGRKVVLYFYPKDDTPGCTVEACGFRDAWKDFEKAGAVVLGVSPDDQASHERFKKKFELPFRLLSDPGNRASRAYGAFGRKVLYGKEYEGVLRSTFVIGADGRLRKVFRKVKPEVHAAEVLEALRAA